MIKNMSFTISYLELSNKVRKTIAPSQKAFKNKKAYNRKQNKKIQGYD